MVPRIKREIKTNENRIYLIYRCIKIADNSFGEYVFFSFVSFPREDDDDEEEGHERKKRTLRDSFVEPTYSWAAARREAVKTKSPPFFGKKTRNACYPGRDGTRKDDGLELAGFAVAGAARIKTSRCYPGD